MGVPRGVEERVMNGPTMGDASLAERLRADVEALARDIGERHFERPVALAAATDWVARRLATTGRSVSRLPYEAHRQRVENLELAVPGRDRPTDILIVGVHYDTVWGTPGANDNGSGVAAMLAIAEAISAAPLPCTVRFVAFVNEEPPYFQSEDMGSYRYARACRERGDRITGMLSLETMGYYVSKPGSQRFPDPALAARFPDVGNFLALVGDPRSVSTLETAAAGFRAVSDFPLEAAVLPPGVPGVAWSDQWAFWQFGYPGLMATDTAPFRYPWYHEPDDTPDKLDFAGLAGATTGLLGAVRALGGA